MPGRSFRLVVGTGTLLLALGKSDRGYANDSVPTARAQGQQEGEVTPLLSIDPPGSMLLAKATGARKIVVRGLLLDPNGTPISGKTVCPIVVDAEKITGVVADLPAGRLTAVTAKSDASGRFQISIPRFPQVAISPCEISGVNVKLLWPTPILTNVDESRTTVDLGKIAPLKR